MGAGCVALVQLCYISGNYSYYDSMCYVFNFSGLIFFAPFCVWLFVPGFIISEFMMGAPESKNNKKKKQQRPRANFLLKIEIEFRMVQLSTRPYYDGCITYFKSFKTGKMV